MKSDYFATDVLWPAGIPAEQTTPGGWTVSMSPGAERAAGTPWRWRLGMTLVIGVMTGSASAGYGKGNVQGTAAQGTHLSALDRAGQGVAGVPLDNTWLNGNVLAGFVPEGDDRALLTIVDFAGDQVKAFVRDSNEQVNLVELHPRELMGLEWTEPRCDRTGRCSTVRYRVVDATMDRSRNTMAEHGSNRDVWLYQVEHTTAESPAPGDWRNVCGPESTEPETGEHGEREPASRDLSRPGYGLFVNGYLAGDGSWNAGYAYACTRGALAKCIRSWGYKPWSRLRTGDGRMVSLRPLHRACVRAARADYCGDGVSFTRDGTMIDLFDVFGFNHREPGLGFRPEAGFDSGGAVWVERTRWPIGARERDSDIMLPGCERPRQGAGRAIQPGLIRVDSPLAP